MGGVTIVLAGLLAVEPAPERTGSAVIVLTFEGADLTYVAGEPSDPVELTTPFSECAGPFPALDDPEVEAAVLERVAELFAPYDVAVTDTVPCEGPFVRAIVGPADHCGPGLGYSELDCDRRLGHGMVYVRVNLVDHTVDEMSVAIAHEVGHAFGLGHVDDPTDVMHPSVGTGQDKAFRDRCSPSAVFGADACGLVGACPLLDPQGRNSHFGLASAIGLADETPAAPTCGGSASGGCACGVPGGGNMPIGMALGLLVVLAVHRIGHA